MSRIDLRKELPHLYRPSARRVTRVDVPAFRFLMIDGEGDPETSPAYAEAVQALFSVSYTAKFMLKRGPRAIDCAVMPLEGLWWADDLGAFTAGHRAAWKWTMMILQPEVVDPDTLRAARVEVARKKALPALEQLRVEVFEEGPCAQTLHIGPFQEEGPTVERVHDFIRATSRLRGKHHEIYLSDIRRAKPSAWRTIIRQPMA